MYRTFIKSFSLFAIVALAGFFSSCQQEDTVTSVDNFVLQSTTGMEDQCGAGAAGCYELVFPVTIQFSDSTTTVVGSYEELKQAIRDWFVANDVRPGHGHGGHHGGVINKPTLVLPIQVINDAGEIITIATVEELKALRALCNPGQGGPGNGGPGYHGGEPCFTINFPLTISFADSTQVVVNSNEELKAATRTWNQNNPGLHARPEFVFPITVTLSDSTQVVVNSREELRALKEDCRG